WSRRALVRRSHGRPPRGRRERQEWRRPGVGARVARDRPGCTLGAAPRVTSGMKESTPATAAAPDLAARIAAGEERALARAMTLIERADAASDELLKALRPRTGRARVIGVTGSPGSGKSTLTDVLIATYREAGDRVGVVAIDPSSPFSGGAILGDRIRMMRWHDDSGVFIRSMATRGQLGGLAAATLQMVALLDGAGFDHVIVETVG